jgi:hypothetical protein
LLAAYRLFRYKFDDERVTKEDTKKALEEQYGGEEEVAFFIKNSPSVTIQFFVSNLSHLAYCISLPFFMLNSCLK